MQGKNTKNYRHYIGIEWSGQHVLIARMLLNSTDIVGTTELKADIKSLKKYLRGLSGTVPLRPSDEQFSSMTSENLHPSSL